MKKDGGSAFPTSKRVTEKYMDEGGYGQERTFTVEVGGMSLRDYFAAKALQGMVANDQIIDVLSETACEWVAKHAFLIADAMLTAREQ